MQNWTHNPHAVETIGGGHGVVAETITDFTADISLDAAMVLAATPIGDVVKFIEETLGVPKWQLAAYFGSRRRSSVAVVKTGG